MNILEKIIYFLQGEMVEPQSYGWFHLMWISLSFVMIFMLCKIKAKDRDKKINIILLSYGIIAFVLELLKQISWSFNYDVITGIVTWDFEWYAFPFQLCTTPIYVSLLAVFIKKERIKEMLLSYLAFITILGSIVTMIIPDSCFVSDILVNIHTMWLHCGSFVVSMYLLITNEVKINIKNLIGAIKVFLIFVLIAMSMNLIIYNSGILNGETFNMFFISPYFISTLPVFDVVQENVPYLIYLFFYIIVIVIGSMIIYILSYLIQKTLHHYKNKSI